MPDPTGLARVAPSLAVGPVDLGDVDALPAQEPGEAGPIGPGSLDADLGDLPEAAQPGEQVPVAGSIGRERLGADQSAQRIEGCSYMDVEVGVDTPGDRRWSFYDGHGHPFLLVRCEGWHGRP
jgi:hypothetical protein